MPDKITQSRLLHLVDHLNKLTGSPDMPYHQTQAEGYVAHVGHFQIDSSNGGVSLERVHNKDGGVVTILERSSKRELYEEIHAYIRGYELAAALNDNAPKLLYALKTLLHDCLHGNGASAMGKNQEAAAAIIAKVEGR